MANAREQITDALLSYCRGIDRLRAADVLAAFHPGAMLHGYGADSMAAEAFAEYAVSALAKRYTATQHRITNTRIEFNDDNTSALVETYVEASHIEPFSPDVGGHRLQVFVGRYIDTCTPNAEGIWKIADRTLRNDWSRVDVVSEAMQGTWTASGRGDRPDPIDR